MVSKHCGWSMSGCVALSAALSPYALAQVPKGDAVTAPSTRQLTLERVFASPDLSGPQPRALKLSPDGTLVTLLKPRADEKERYDLWAIDTRTGAERMLIDSKKVGSGAALSEAE